MATGSPDKLIQRTVFFFQARTRKGNEPAIVCDGFETLLGNIKNLKFVDGGGPRSRYEYDSDGRRLGCWPKLVGRVGCIFGEGRDDDFPALEARGDMKDVDAEDDVWVTESTHAVFFKDGVVGMESHKRGPSPKMIAGYLKTKTGDALAGLEFHPLLLPDVVKRLRSLEELYVARVRIPYTAAEREGLLAEVGEFSAVRNIAGPGEFDIEIIIRKNARKKGNTLSARAGAFLSRIFRSGEATALEAHGKPHDGKMVELDLLSERVSVKCGMRRETKKSRRIACESAFTEIENAYRANRDALYESIEMLSRRLGANNARS